MTPLAVMLATMRWAHAEAEAACARVATLAGADAGDAAKAALRLRARALEMARVVAPYVHARLRAATTPARDGVRSHEEWIAALEGVVAEGEAPG
jgi:hypothetical protein